MTFSVSTKLMNSILPKHRPTAHLIVDLTFKYSQAVSTQLENERFSRNQSKVPYVGSLGLLIPMSLGRKSDHVGVTKIFCSTHSSHDSSLWRMWCFVSPYSPNRGSPKVYDGSPKVYTDQIHEKW